MDRLYGNDHGNGQMRNIRVGTINAATLNRKEEKVVMMMEKRRVNLLGICKASVPGFGSYWECAKQECQDLDPKLSITTTNLYIEGITKNGKMARQS